MAVGDETLIDAPVTPAPVFAYRALRAVFWGDEETPEQPSRRSRESLDAYGESRPASEITENPPTNLTPGKKRKISLFAQPSPSKSILRTPGVHTPRRALLKDLNVTFKDIRTTVSPEVREEEFVLSKDKIKNNVNKENEPTAPKNTEPMSRKPEISRVTAKADAEAARLATEIPTTTQAAPTSMITPIIHGQTLATLQSTTNINTTVFEANAFMRNTEKEMKKLIKYGQKMREYARKQDIENARLRMMLDEIRAENERLRTQLEIANCGSNKLKQPAKLKDMDTFTKQTSSLGRSNQHPQKPKTSNKTTDFDILDTEDEAPVKSKPRSDNLANSRSNSFLLEPDFLLDPPRISSSVPSFSSKNQRLSNHITSNSQQRTSTQTHPKPQTPKQPRIQSQPQSHHHQLPLRTISNGATSVLNTTRSTHDRLAAARARVQKKAELRKASAGSNEAVDVENTNGVGNGDSESKAEMSLVDWAGL